MTDTPLQVDVYRVPFTSPRRVVWAEINGEYGLVHPSDMLERVRYLVNNNQDFYTVNEIALLCLCYMVRTGELKPTDFEIWYTNKTGERQRMPVDVQGEFIRPWPEDEENGGIFGADFWLRYGP